MNTINHLPTRKRFSKRSSATRDSNQLSPKDYPFLDEGIKVYPVACEANGKRRYRFNIENSTDNIHEMKNLDDAFRSAGITIRAKTLQGMINALMDVLPKYIAEKGCSVRLGDLVTFKPYVTGTVESANDQPDPATSRLEIRAVVGPALRHSLTQAKLVNRCFGRGIDRVIGGPSTSRSKGVIDAENEINVFGWNIYVPQTEMNDDSRGKIWIETLDGVFLGRCVVTTTGPDFVIAKFEPVAPVTVDEVRLVLETCGTAAAAKESPAPPLARYDCTLRFLHGPSPASNG